jgi:hypothetical protein
MKLPSEPVIDGTLSDECWRSADKLDLFVKTSHRLVPASKVTEVYIGHAGQAKAIVGTDTWTLEIVVPFSDLGISAPGEGWMMNLCRTDH